VHATGPNKVHRQIKEVHRQENKTSRGKKRRGRQTRKISTGKRKRSIGKQGRQAKERVENIVIGRRQADLHDKIITSSPVRQMKVPSR
jgi:hypothetical protein